MSRHRWMIGDLHVATLVWVDGDFPWTYGRFEPQPVFAMFMRYFRPLLDDGALWIDDDALAAAGHPPETWRLVPEAGGDDGEPVFLHALVLRGKDKVTWRFGLSPLDLD